MNNCEPHQFTECHIQHWLWLIVPAIQIAVGTSGNIISIIILSRPNMRKLSVNVYLLSLAGADIVFLWSSNFPKFKLELTGTRFEDQSTLSCKVLFFLVDTSAVYSGWLLVFITVERVVVTKWPIIARTRLSTKNAGTASGILLLMCLIFSSHNLFGRHLETLSRHGNNSEVVGDYNRCTPTTDAFDRFYSAKWNVVMMLINIIHVITVIVGNITIFATLAVKKRPVQSVRRKRETSTTKMLFVLSGVFMLTTLPFTVFIVLTGNTENESPIAKARTNLCKTILVLLLYCNFTFNFFLYFVSGRMFKQEWKRLAKPFHDKFCLFLSIDIRSQPRSSIIGIRLNNVEGRERNNVT